MNVALMRGIDRWAGVPLCRLTAILLNARGRARAACPREPGAILLVKMFGLGSVLLSAPLVSALRRRYPRARILYATFASNAQMLDRIPGIDTGLLISTSTPAAFLRTALRALLTARAARPAVVFDLEFFSKFTTAFAALSGAPVRVGFALPTRWRTGNITHAVPLDHESHVAAQFLRQLSAVGPAPPPTDPPAPRILPDGGATARLAEKLPRSPDAGNIVCVNINAGPISRERRWPSGRFMEVVRRLRALHPGLLFVFTGASEERAYVENAVAAHPDLLPAVWNSAGLLDVEELIALLAAARLLLTNDSGPMHIAAAAGTPVVALFGPESPVLYGPLGESRVITRSLPCSPCLSVYNAKLFRCPYDARCMKEIGIEEVVSAAEDLLREQLRPVTAHTTATAHASGSLSDRGRNAGL